MSQLESEKWYNIEMLVDVLLFVFPPLGIYAIYKTDTIKSKANRLIGSLFGVASFMSAVLFLLN